MVVLAYAAATGLVVVGFTLLAEAASHGFDELQRLGPYGPYLPLIWTPLLTMLVVWWTRRLAPATAGSGIPQVVRALDDDLNPTQREWLVSVRISLHKIGLVSGGLLAGLVAVSVFGNETYFGTLRVQSLSWSLLLPGLAVALVAGLAGGVFTRLLVVSVRGLPDRYSRWRRDHPLRFAGGCALLVAVICVATGGATAGAGYAPTRALLEGHADLPGVYTLLKFCASWLSAWAGVPAGMFAPALAIGAGIGNDVALLTGLGRDAAIPLIALGMVGFLAATTQGPITAFIIVMEMVSGQAMVLSLMACALLAGGVARLMTPRLYQELAALLPVPPASPAPPQA